MRVILVLAVVSVLASPGLACEMHQSHAVMASSAVKPVLPPPPVTEAKAEAPQSLPVKSTEPIKAEAESLPD